MINIPNAAANNQIEVLEENLERYRGNPTEQNTITMRGIISAWFTAHIISLEQRNAYEREVNAIHG